MTAPETSPAAVGATTEHPDDVELRRLHSVSTRLRAECPWDSEQTHRSLATHLVEETGEVLDAIEQGDDADLVEELGDLLMQVYFHVAIAEQQGRFTMDDVAGGVADKLVRRHPHVFAGAEVPDDLGATWEAQKKVEKQRDSALDGIADHLSVLARSAKVASRIRNHKVSIALADEPITADEVGQQILTLVQRAHASGVDADQAGRDALRALEQQVRAAESTPSSS